jgi:exopolysaccharide biosynthesis WecB/TagA/CpsF family protein
MKPLEPTGASRRAGDFVATEALFPKARIGYGFVSMASDLLAVGDFLGLVAITFLNAILFTHWQGSAGKFDINSALAFDHSALVAVILAPFILYDRRFGSHASAGHLEAIGRSFLLRFVGFSILSGGLMLAGDALPDFPYQWLITWLLMCLGLTGALRYAMFRGLRHLQRHGVLTEVIAVVGKGPAADRLIQDLRTRRPESVELLGVFDDKIIGAVSSIVPSAGNLERLLELGKTHKIDWILITLPPTAEVRLLSIVKRLKALSVPIALCPQYPGRELPYQGIDFVGDRIPVHLLADRPKERRELLLERGYAFLPSWMLTMIMLGLDLIGTLHRARPPHAGSTAHSLRTPLTLQFDNYEPSEFKLLASEFGQNQYGYVVTPNADHIIRLRDDPAFVELYDRADFILLDSRFLARILRWTRNLKLPVCTGSDLTAALLSDVVRADDRLVVIGGSRSQVRFLSVRYQLRAIAHHNPPMGFIRDPQAVEECLAFIELHSPFRFCLLAVGSPQQEILARRLQERGTARGLALCVGASLDFLTGAERRAPLWLQRAGFEWSYRLLQAPRRMAKRYLIRGPRVFWALRRARIVLRMNTGSGSMGCPYIPANPPSRLPHPNGISPVPQPSSKEGITSVI